MEAAILALFVFLLGWQVLFRGFAYVTKLRSIREQEDHDKRMAAIRKEYLEDSENEK
jgi:hypothetical protein